MDSELCGDILPAVEISCSRRGMYTHPEHGMDERRFYTGLK